MPPCFKGGYNMANYPLSPSRRPGESNQDWFARVSNLNVNQMLNTFSVIVQEIETINERLDGFDETLDDFDEMIRNTSIEIQSLDDRVTALENPQAG